MLHKSKGKWKWQTKATYSTEWSLDKVILAYLEKLYETIKDRENIGIPIYYCNRQAIVEGFHEYDYSCDIDIDFDAARQLRLRDLEELIWTFTDNEPDISDYGFNYESDEGLRCTNDVERDRYAKDVKVWSKRKQEGRKLFGELYNTLSW